MAELINPTPLVFGRKATERNDVRFLSSEVKRLEQRCTVESCFCRPLIRHTGIRSCRTPFTPCKLLHIVQTLTRRTQDGEDRELIDALEIFEVCSALLHHVHGWRFLSYLIIAYFALT